ncbi:unnamed protein product, partial [Urochloa humidicola]
TSTTPHTQQREEAKEKRIPATRRTKGEPPPGAAAAATAMSKMMSALSNWLVNPRRNPLARLHMHSVSSRLRKYGLRYDDLYDPYFDLDIKEALGRLPREVVDARIQRLKRAMDLSMKHQYLPEDVQVKKESAEREALGALPLYQRTIP